MSMSDPLGDMITRIRNAQRSRHANCVAPASKLRANVLEALKREPLDPLLYEYLCKYGSLHSGHVQVAK